ncbi:MAG TPA: glutamate synthase large subunit, partial [Hansschlegelia sp.]
YGLPIALLQYQDYEAILKAKTRKDLLEELGVAVAGWQVRKFKLAYRDQRPILGGLAPAEGEGGAQAGLVLLNNYAVLAMAQELALARLPGVSDLGHPAVASAVRKLLLTEDFALMQKLLRHAREALGSYGDEELAALVADKRLSDYKAALAQRNVLSMDSPGVYGWILRQSAKNRAALGRLPSYEELFARASLREVAAFASRP